LHRCDSRCMHRCDHHCMHGCNRPYARVRPIPEWDQKRGPPPDAGTAKYENAVPRPTEIEVGALLCDNEHTMSDANRTAPISDLLKRTIRKAIEDGRTNFKALERETGVTRASIMRFVRGSQSLRLDMADKIAAFFGLELQPSKDRQPKGKTKKG